MQYLGNNGNHAGSQLNEIVPFSSAIKNPTTLPRNLSATEIHSSRCSSNNITRSASNSDNNKGKTLNIHQNLPVRTGSITHTKRTDDSMPDGGTLSGTLCRMHEAEAVAIKAENTKSKGHDITCNNSTTQADSHFSSTSLQSSSSSGSTTASTSTCKFQNSPPSTLPKPMSLSNEDNPFKEGTQRVSGEISELNYSSIKRNSTATPNMNLNSKPQKFTTFCIPEAQILISPPPKEFDSNNIKMKSPLPSALSSSSSSSGLAGSTISPVSSPTVSFADKPTYA